MTVKVLKNGKWRDRYYLRKEVLRAWQRYEMLSSRWNKPIEPALEGLKDELIGSINDESYLNLDSAGMTLQIMKISNALPYIRPGRCKG